MNLTIGTTAQNASLTCTKRKATSS